MKDVWLAILVGVIITVIGFGGLVFGQNQTLTKEQVKSQFDVVQNQIDQYERYQNLLRLREELKQQYQALEAKEKAAKPKEEPKKEDKKK
jgi:hypothetical protein